MGREWIWQDDIMALLQQVSRYMLRPLSVLNGKIVNVSALTEECRDKSDLDF